MANKVSVEDLRAMFAETLCMYNNRPYFIEHISERYKATCINLFTQRQEVIDIDENTFAAPVRRIGFVNSKQSVMYLTRTPVRRYKSGLCRNNTDFAYIPGVEYPFGADHTMRHLYNLRAVEIADAMFGKYPTIEECIQAFKEDRASAMAFDHQFALTEDGEVYYKLEKVGTYNDDAKTPYDLVFKPQWQYLISLLDKNYEKSISAA